MPADEKKRCALLVAFGMVALSRAALPPIVYVARRQYAVDHHNTGADFTAGDVSCHNVRPGAAIRRLDGTDVTTLLDCPQGVIRDLEVSWDARRLHLGTRGDGVDMSHTRREQDGRIEA